LAHFDTAVMLPNVREETILDPETTVKEAAAIDIWPPADGFKTSHAHEQPGRPPRLAFGVWQVRPPFPDQGIPVIDCGSKIKKQDRHQTQVSRDPGDHRRVVLSKKLNVLVDAAETALHDAGDHKNVGGGHRGLDPSLGCGHHGLATERGAGGPETMAVDNVGRTSSARVIVEGPLVSVPAVGSSQGKGPLEKGGGGWIQLEHVVHVKSCVLVQSGPPDRSLQDHCVPRHMNHPHLAPMLELKAFEFLDEAVESQIARAPPTYRQRHEKMVLSSLRSQNMTRRAGFHFLTHKK
jgi:hypothetical protein